MSSILLPSTRIAQPAGLVDVDGEYLSSLKLSEVFYPSGNVFSKTLIREYSPYISSGTINTGIGGGGRSVKFPSNLNGCSLIIADNASDVFASPTTASILIVRQSIKSDIYSSGWTTSFGYNQSANDRILAHMPGADGYVYFDFGGTDSARRIQTTFTVAKSTDLEVWCFVAGPTKGREIWRNGIKLAGNASIKGALTTNTAALRLGAMPTDYCDAEHIYLFAVGISEWSDLTIKKLSSNPFQMLRKKNTSIYFDMGAASGGAAYNCSVGNALATGVTTSFPLAINASVGDATATGTTATRDLRIECAIGNAAAQGLTAAISGALTVGCSVGDALASSVAALIGTNITIDTTVGNALSAGEQAAIQIGQFVNTAVGNAAAVGVQAQLLMAQTINATVADALATGVQANVSISVPMTLTQADIDAIVAAIPSASDIADAVHAKAQVTPIHSNMMQTNNEALIGDGTEGNKFRSHLVP